MGAPCQSPGDGRGQVPVSLLWHSMSPDRHILWDLLLSLSLLGPEEVLPWANSVLRRITTYSIRARKSRDGKAVQLKVEEVEQTRKDFCRTS